MGDGIQYICRMGDGVQYVHVHVRRMGDGVLTVQYVEWVMVYGT